MKNICKLILTLSLFPLSALALGTPGFDTGNDFQAVRLTGEIHVMCNNHNGGSESAFFQCREEYLSPAEYARFVGPTADADEVVLKATREIIRYAVI